jgi:O-antigen/teichoic acid export membrane protein
MEERAVSHFKEGLFWIGSASGLEFVLNFLKLVVTARLLSKEDLGVFALALVFIGFIENMSRTGFGQALIQTPKDPEPYIDAVWSFVIVKNAVIGSLGILAAPGIAAFFNEPRVAPVIRILGLAYIVSGLKSQRYPLLRRNLQFRQFALIRNCTVLLQVAVAITIAVIYRNIYALVGGYAIGQLAEVAFSHLLIRQKPRFAWDFKKTRELSGFGVWITLESGIQYFGQTIDRAMLGKLLNSVSLGLYSVANNLVQSAMLISGSVINSIMFPMFSRIQDEKTRRAAWIVRLSAISIILGGLFTSVLIGTARFFIPLLLSDKWTSSIKVVEVLAFVPIFYLPVFTSGQPFFKGMGRPDIMTKIQIVRIALLFPLSWTAIHSHGVLGLAWAVVGTSAGVAVFWLWCMVRQGGIPIGRIVLAFGLAAAMASLAWILSHEVLAGMKVQAGSLALSGILVVAIPGIVLSAAYVFLRPVREIFLSIKDLVRTRPA